MRILITGSTGLLGQAVATQFQGSHRVIRLARREIAGPGRVVCDLSRRAAVERVVRLHRPDVIVHAAALTDVDACEQRPRAAIDANVLATYHLAAAAARHGCWLLAISTDYVFDGRRTTPYPETAEPRPLSVYGWTKWLAERIVDGLVERAMIIRVSSLFGPGRSTFVDQLAARAARGDAVEAFRDQVTSPTYSVDAAEGLVRIAETVMALPAAEQLSWRGVYHLTNTGAVSRVALAAAVLRLAGYSRTLLHPIPIAQQHRPAQRPCYSALGARRVARLIGHPLRPWEQALEAYWQWKHSDN